MFYDYHTHTNFSDDSPAPIETMIQEAINLGLAEVAITDHFDPAYPDPDFPFEINLPKYHEEMEAMCNKYEGVLPIIRGVEVGLQTDQMGRCQHVVDSYDYDFVIASFHCCMGEPLFNGHFFDNKDPSEYYEQFYMTVLNCLREYKRYSVLGHINVIDRYAPIIADRKIYMDIIDEILKIIINGGKGIETNTSSYRYNMASTIPQDFILKRYLELGGEIITTGSDAHQPEHLAYNFGMTYERLKSLGFRYITTYREMKPSFIKL